MKEQIFNSFKFGGRCGGFEGTYFSSFFFWGEYLVVLKELIFKFVFGRVWWS